MKEIKTVSRIELISPFLCITDKMDFLHCAV